ncbi:MAG: fumarylacetoacetate hydrolase family protein [Gammaproteobacteria bacterium]|nr:fumarylacetoacetate hydrolase family protein [Gammaproteobacteria bacterium]MBL6999947.1 fumarylacetoacetate hydrolase family protein [Gammaproteobacteria bacterium]
MNKIQIGQQQLTPGKIVCVGRNYAAHIEELKNEVADEMVVFSKPNSAISDQLHAIHQEAINYEGELCFVVEDGRFAAVGFGLDLTKRALQDKLKAKGLPWERAKAFDGAALFSPFVRISEVDPALTLELEINGTTVQKADTSLMLYKPATILNEISRFMTLNDGDIVMTGTPKGVGIIQPGERYNGKITLRGAVISQAEWIAR